MAPWQRGPFSCPAVATAAALLSRCFNTVSALRAAAPRPRHGCARPTGFSAAPRRSKACKFISKATLQRFQGLLRHNQGGETALPSLVLEPKSEGKNSAGDIQNKNRPPTAAAPTPRRREAAVNRNSARPMFLKIHVGTCKIHNKTLRHHRTKPPQVCSFVFLHSYFTRPRLSSFFGKCERLFCGLCGGMAARRPR